MNKFTSGPWRVKHQKAGFCSIVYTEKLKSGGHAFPEIGMVGPFGHQTPEEKKAGIHHLVLVTGMPAYSKNVDDNRIEMMANANLIAAAPDLLDACKRALRELKDGEPTVGLEENLAAAIAKAVGEQ